MARQSSGFSFLEFTLVIALTAIASTVAVVQLLPTTRTDSALEQMLMQLRQARMNAIDQRRNFTVTFQGTNEVVVVRQEVPTGTTAISDTFLPQGVAYTLFTGLPDTPDGFGKTYPVNFGCPGNTVPCSIVFQSDGSVVSNGTLVNGTVFMGIAGSTDSARAVTVMGSTGRIHPYHSDGASWF